MNSSFGLFVPVFLSLLHSVQDSVALSYPVGSALNPCVEQKADRYSTKSSFSESTGNLSLDDHDAIR